MFNKHSNSSGFTLIELLMAVVIVSVLAVVVIPQFIDFREEGRQALAQTMQSAIQTGIVLQRSNMVVRCGAPTNAWPAAADIQANDITNGSSYCTPSQIPVAERQFLQGYSGGLPVNPLGDPPLNVVIDCGVLGTCPASTTRRDNLNSETLLAQARMEKLWRNAPHNAFTTLLKIGQSLLDSPWAFAADVQLVPLTSDTPCQGPTSSYSHGWCYNSKSGFLWSDSPPPLTASTPDENDSHSAVEVIANYRPE